MKFILRLFWNLRITTSNKKAPPDCLGQLKPRKRSLSADELKREALMIKAELLFGHLKKEVPKLGKGTNKVS
jgi:hypothetical protein